MYISTLYSKNKLSIKQDLSIELKLQNKQEENIENESHKHVINEKIKDIDVSDIESVLFKKNDGKNFTIKSKNLFKIVVYIVHHLGKNQFKPWELEEIYSNVVNNYTSELSETDYKKVLWVIKDFVKVWGSVEINKK